MQRAPAGPWAPAALSASPGPSAGAAAGPAPPPPRCPGPAGPAASGPSDRRVRRAGSGRGVTGARGRPRTCRPWLGPEVRVRSRWGSRPAQRRRDTAGSRARSPQERRGEQQVPGGAGVAGGCEAALVKPCRRRAFPAAAGFTEQTPGSPAPGGLSCPGSAWLALAGALILRRNRLPPPASVSFRAASGSRFSGSGGGGYSFRCLLACLGPVPGAAGAGHLAQLPPAARPVCGETCAPRCTGRAGGGRPLPSAREPFPWSLPHAFGVPSISQSQGTLVLQYCRK